MKEKRTEESQSKMNARACYNYYCGLEHSLTHYSIIRLSHQVRIFRLEMAKLGCIVTMLKPYPKQCKNALLIDQHAMTVSITPHQRVDSDKHILLLIALNVIK